MASEQEPFLAVKDEEDLQPTEPEAPRHRRSNRTWTTWTIYLLAQTVLLMLCAAGTVWMVRLHDSRVSNYGASLHDAKLEFAPKTFHNLSRSRFAGEPSPEIDATWDELLAPMNIRVTKAELDSENVESVVLPEGGGYLSWIGAFHQLHCINMLRKWVHPEYYHADMTPAAKKHMESHVDHCIEFLRQSALCRPDLSLTTFKWDPQKTRPMFNASESSHTCVNWDILIESMAARRVTENEILSLKNPLTATMR
ncbi:hypothetical protein XANCAGTX0491_009309 [Xanthoria calcicola]